MFGITHLFVIILVFFVRHFVIPTHQMEVQVVGEVVILQIRLSKSL
jgi:hypothetical protein